MKNTAYTSPYGRWITILFFVLAFYGIGASMMDYFVVYHTWRFIGEAEFAQAHIASGSRIIPIFVFPLLVMTVMLILLFWHRHQAISRKLLWVALACVSITWISSAFIQIPMQFKLDLGRDEELLNQLILTDWIRVIPTWILLIVTINMLGQCLQESRSTEK
jgi:hypothetical protein